MMQKNRPKDIEWFAYIQIAVMVVGFINGLINWDALIATPGNSVLMQIASQSVSYIITFTLLYFIVMRASNVARWILVVISGLGFLFLIPLLLTNAVPIPGGKIVPSIMTLASLASFYFLFTPAARRWFSKDADPSNTFS